MKRKKFRYTEEERKQAYLERLERLRNRTKAQRGYYRTTIKDPESGKVKAIWVKSKEKLKAYRTGWAKHWDKKDGKLAESQGKYKRLRALKPCPKCWMYCWRNKELKELCFLTGRVVTMYDYFRNAGLVASV